MRICSLLTVNNSHNAKCLTWHCWKVESTKNGKFWWLPRINLESPRSSRRVDSTGLGSNDEDANKGCTEKATDDNFLLKLSYGWCGQRPGRCCFSNKTSLQPWRNFFKALSLIISRPESTRVQTICEPASHWKNRSGLQRPSVLLAWRLHREMRRWLILQETKQIYLLNVFYFLSTPILFTCFWIDFFVSNDWKYVCGRRLYACINTRKFYRPWFQRNNIIARYRKSDLHGMSFQSSPKVNCMLIQRLICTQWKFTTPDHHNFANSDSLFFFRPLSSVHLLQSNQCFQAIEFVDRHVPEKL